MEVAVGSFLALGDVASLLGYAGTQYQSSNGGRNPDSRSHPGTYSNNASDEKTTRTHSGIYCNPAFKRRSLPPVTESQSSCLESSGSDDVPSQPLSPRSGSDCDSDCGSDHSPPPTSRLVLPSQAFKQSSKEKSASKYLLSLDSLCAVKLQMPTPEKLCPPRSGSPLRMAPQTHELDDAMSSKISAGCGYLLPLTVKNVSIASNKTSSTCSDLDTSSSLSTASFNLSSTLEQQTPESLCCEEVESLRDGDGRKRKPLGANPIDQNEVLSAEASVSKARSFCRQAFAECDLGNLEEEIADVTKDLEALRASFFAKCS